MYRAPAVAKLLCWHVQRLYTPRFVCARVCVCVFVCVWMCRLSVVCERTLLELDLLSYCVATVQYSLLLSRQTGLCVLEWVCFSCFVVCRICRLHAQCDTLCCSIERVCLSGAIVDLTHIRPGPKIRTPGGNAVILFERRLFYHDSAAGVEGIGLFSRCLRHCELNV